MQRGVEIPERIRQAPVLSEWLQGFYNDFHILSSCRSMGGFGLGPIPWTAVHAYALAQGYEGAIYDDLHHFVMQMDLVYLETLNTRE